MRRHPWQTTRLGFMALCLSSLFSGCGPKVSEAELGEMVHEVSRLPGFGKPYAMPRLESVQRDTPGADGGALEAVRRGMEARALINSAPQTNASQAPEGEKPAEASPSPAPAPADAPPTESSTPEASAAPPADAPGGP